MSIEWTATTSGQAVAAHFANQIKDKIILLTGPSLEGIGLATAQALAAHGPRLLILAGRNITKLEAARDVILKDSPTVSIRLLQVDLSSMASVRAAAEQVNKYEENIDIVINNAAVMGEQKITSEGHELHFASNYLGHWLLTNSILPKVLASDGKRIVNVASLSHVYGPIRWDDPAFKEGYNSDLAYGQSKTGNMLFTVALAKRYGDQGLTAFSLHPGGIITPLQQHWTLEDKIALNDKIGAEVFNPDGTAKEGAGWKTLDQGSSTTLRAALDPSIANQNGAYLDDCEVRQDKAMDHAKSEENAERLWDMTNKLLGENF